MALYDEANPAGGIGADSEAGRVIGLSAAMSRPAMLPAPHVQPTYYTPDPHKVQTERTFVSARPVAMLTVNPTPSKYADDTMNPGVTFAPVLGPADKQLAALAQGYNPYATKDPKARATDHPSTSRLVANAAQPPAGMSSDEGYLLALLEGA